ncbi:protein ANTAGONIST OF LIKE HETEROCHROMATIN PROTEIN 1 [Syzygium oleosum]|uniref:protein ANTAGONIST OF LIKE HETEROCHROMATIN PROTEIN 1 n=1 Tax=Syzygium oleosum TaxID=219896 RepID=UPI0024BB8C01|nr:protein ANTAGONIST OF LIKE HETEROCHROMATIN PROTEIN 1 [Syzygium oleosum]
MAAGIGGGGESSAAASSTATATARPKAKKRRNDHLEPLVSLLAAATSAARSFLLRNDLNLLPSQALALESRVHSASSSLGSLASLLSLPPPPRPLPPPPPPPQDCWFRRFLSATHAADFDPRWTHFFRMSKPSFSLLLRLVSPSLQSALPSIPPDHALAAALYRLAHATPYKVVGRLFGLDSADACRSFFAVCRAINENLGDLLELYSNRERIIVGFGWILLPNCCGILGFGRFRVDGDWLGGNGCLLVQALVDSEGRFLDVSAGWPSSLRPDSILCRTPLFSAVEESRELLSGPNFVLSNGSSIPQYILGDACFPLLPWLLTPYNEENSFSSIEMEFNSVHSRAMGLVRRAFARVRARWELLSKPLKEEHVEFFPIVIFAGCLLHNFLMQCSEPVFDENGVGEWEEDQEVPAYEGEVNKFGQVVRDALAQHLSWVSLRD